MFILGQEIFLYLFFFMFILGQEIFVYLFFFMFILGQEISSCALFALRRSHGCRFGREPWLSQVHWQRGGLQVDIAEKNRGKIAMPIVMRELQYILFVKNQVEVDIVDNILQTLGLVTM